MSGRSLESFDEGYRSGWEKGRTALMDRMNEAEARVAVLERFRQDIMTELVEPDDDGTPPAHEWDAWPKRLSEDKRMTLARLWESSEPTASAGTEKETTCTSDEKTEKPSSKPLPGSESSQPTSSGDSTETSSSSRSTSRTASPPPGSSSTSSRPPASESEARPSEAPKQRCEHEWQHRCGKCGEPSELDGCTETERSSALAALRKIASLEKHDSPVYCIAVEQISVLLAHAPRTTEAPKVWVAVPPNDGTTEPAWVDRWETRHPPTRFGEQSEVIAEVSASPGGSPTALENAQRIARLLNADEGRPCTDYPRHIVTTADINALVQKCRPTGDPAKDGALGTKVEMGFEAVQDLVTRFAEQAGSLERCGPWPTKQWSIRGVPPLEELRAMIAGYYPEECPETPVVQRGERGSGADRVLSDVMDKLRSALDIADGDDFDPVSAVMQLHARGPLGFMRYVIEVLAREGDADQKVRDVASIARRLAPAIMSRRATLKEGTGGG